MISNARKTIGVFINQSDGNFENLIYHGVQKRAKELDYDVIFFCTVGTRASGNSYDILERGMFSFAPVERLDGIIAAPNSYEMANTQDIFFDMLKARVKCPVVFVRASYKDYCCVSTDEKHAIRPLLTHLIEDQGLKNIAFMAGYPGHADSEMRLNCYKDEMIRHNLPLTERSIFYGDMWKKKGEEAFHFFFDDTTRENRPQVVVCANDYMAFSFIDAVRQNGLRVPDDVIVTGFDNIALSEYFNPSVTTVAQDYETMINAAVDLLDRRIKEEEMGLENDPVHLAIPGRLIRRESSGFFKSGQLNERDIIVEHNKRLQEISLREISQTYFSTLLNSDDTLEAMHETIVQKISDVPHLRCFYLCMFQKPNGVDMAEELTDTCQLVMAIKDREDRGMPMVNFSSELVLPPLDNKKEEPQAYFIMLLHKQKSTFGYSVMQYDEGYCPTMFYHHWNVIISNALSNFSNQKKLRDLYEERRLSSISDSLTGLYNRRGLEERLEPLWPELVEKRAVIGFISYDLNNLKYINDSFGHLEGDFALCSVANAIREATPATGISARMGGDEYLTALPMHNEEETQAFVEKYQAALENINDNSGKEYRVSASYGVFMITLEPGVTIDDCLRQSDAKMYEAKRKLKRRRDDHV
ncbi:MAG: GGDEF domain-containing protein [Clostridiales bacterium]|nr:GGDEF domain-containing protein [Clostridiales bacterium]